MADPFDSIPTRSNGQKILYGWFNALKTAGTALWTQLANTTTGHDHDGTDSKKVIATNLDATGATANQVLKYNGSAVVWGTGGGGSGGINYVESNSGNHDAESNTTGWTTYADAAATPVDLTGGTATATWTRSTTSPLRGTGSFLFTSGALGDGVTYTITPDRADIKRGGVMTVTFDYEFSATVATGAYTLWVYDVANSLLVQPAGYQIQGGVSGSTYKHSATFQLPTNGTTFRVGIHQAVASPGGTLKVDNISVGPQAVQYGAPVTDWQSYTPTFSAGLGTASAVAASWRRVGDTMQIRANFTTGTVTASVASITLPSGFAFDTTKLGTSLQNARGFWIRDAADQKFGPMLIDGSVSTGHLYFGGTENNTATNGMGRQNGNTIFSNNNLATVYAEIPISGWSSTVQMSNDTDTRVVAFKGSASPSAIASNGSALSVTTTDFDTHGAYSTGTNRYTVAVPGYYRVGGQLQMSTAGASVYLGIQVAKNGGTAVNILMGHPSNSGLAVCLSGYTMFYANAGDYFTWAYNTGGSVTDQKHEIFCDRLTGPSAIAASETVACMYTTNSGQSLTSGTEATILYGTKNFDTHGSYDTATGRFNCPVAGKYKFSASILFSGLSFSAGNAIAINIRKNGTTDRYLYQHVEGTGTYDQARQNTVYFDLVAGDYVEARVVQNSGGARAIYSSSDKYQWFTAERIG